MLDARVIEGKSNHVVVILRQGEKSHTVILRLGENLVQSF